MKKHRKIIIIVVLANTMFGMDGIEYLEGRRPWTGFTLSSTSLELIFNPLNSGSHSGLLGLVVSDNLLQNRRLKKGDVITLTPNQEIRLTARHGQITFKPVIFKNQKKGFRIVPWLIGEGAENDKPIVTYIALTDTTIKVGEDDVEMIMDDGKWMKIEDSKSLIIDKLGWVAERMVKDAERITNNPEVMARYLNDNYFGTILQTLIKEELITPDLEMFIALTNTGHFSSSLKIEEETPFAGHEELEHKSEDNTIHDSPPPPCRRAWLWWLALPVVAGGWFVIRLRKKT